MHIKSTDFSRYLQSVITLPCKRKQRFTSFNVNVVKTIRPTLKHLALWLYTGTYFINNQITQISQLIVQLISQHKFILRPTAALSQWRIPDSTS